MFGLFRKRPASRLRALLAGYPAWAPPHLGHVLRLPDIIGPVLTPEQARENFLAYREAVPERIALLRPLLAEVGVDLDLAYTDATAFVRQLHPALVAELPALYRPDLLGSVCPTCWVQYAHPRSDGSSMPTLRIAGYCDGCRARLPH